MPGLLWGPSVGARPLPEGVGCKTWSLTGSTPTPASIIVSRRKGHGPTIAYINRKTREGKSVREAIRCLKRHVARHIYRVLERTAMAA
jgi:hypothetical protein